MSAGRSKLQLTYKELCISWEKTSSVWGDTTARSFGERYIESLRPCVKSACDGMEQMSQIIQQVKRECG